MGESVSCIIVIISKFTTVSGKSVGRVVVIVLNCNSRMHVAVVSANVGIIFQYQFSCLLLPLKMGILVANLTEYNPLSCRSS